MTWRDPLWRSTMHTVGDRPVMSQEQMIGLCEQVQNMWTTVDVHNLIVSIRHTYRSTTQMARGAVVTADDGDVLEIVIATDLNHVQGFAWQTNQIDLEVLRSMVKAMEAKIMATTGPNREFDPYDVQDTYLPVNLWHDSTVEAMRTSRSTLLPALVQPLAKQGLVASGNVGFMARAQAIVTRDKIQAYYEETDCEISVTARTRDNTSAGWGGQADRRWEAIDVDAVVNRASDMARRGMNALATEPGRQTVILTRDAVAQLFRYFAVFYDAGETEFGKATPFWQDRSPPNKIGEKVFDPRIRMWSDPSDPDGGFMPFERGLGHANPVMMWAEQGVLKALAMDAVSASARHKAYSEDPWSLRVSGGSTTIAEMIARCEKGIFVNQFGAVERLGSQSDPSSFRAGLLTGVTRDGCFLIKDGKIETPVKNFRFVDSPMFMLNNIVALGEPKRAAYGYTPSGKKEYYTDGWPRRPMIVPPMMVRDFNFTSLADSV